MKVENFKGEIVKEPPTTNSPTTTNSRVCNGVWPLMITLNIPYPKICSFDHCDPKFIAKGDLTPTGASFNIILANLYSLSRRSIFQPAVTGSKSTIQTLE